MVLWVIASAGFAFYVSNFGSYNKTYGALGGVIVFLVWLWISNIAVLLGAEFNAELERGRAIEAGQPAEQEPFMEPRDTRKMESGRLVTAPTKPKADDGPFTGYAEPAERPPVQVVHGVRRRCSTRRGRRAGPARRSGRELPERVEAPDVLLTGVATHKLSRMISKDRITAFARAPFTEFQERGRPAEVEEKPRGSGLGARSASCSSAPTASASGSRPASTWAAVRAAHHPLHRLDLQRADDLGLPPGRLQGLPGPGRGS